MNTSRARNRIGRPDLMSPNRALTNDRERTNSTAPRTATPRGTTPIQIAVSTFSHKKRGPVSGAPVDGNLRYQQAVQSLNPCILSARSLAGKLLAGFCATRSRRKAPQNSISTGRKTLQSNRLSPRTASSNSPLARGKEQLVPRNLRSIQTRDPCGKRREFLQ